MKETGPNYLEINEKLEFQMPDCYNNGCHRMRMHILVQQKNLLGQQNFCTCCKSSASDVLTPSDHNKTSNVHINITMKHVLVHNHCYGGRVIKITYSEWVPAALLIQQAMCMHRIILSSVACLALPHFSTLLHVWQNFQKNVIEHKMHVFIFPMTFVWNTSHSKKKQVQYHHKCTYVFM